MYINIPTFFPYIASITFHPSKGKLVLLQRLNIVKPLLCCHFVWLILEMHENSPFREHGLKCFLGIALMHGTLICFWDTVCNLICSLGKKVPTKRRGDEIVLEGVVPSNMDLFISSTHHLVHCFCASLQKRDLVHWCALTYF